MYILINSTTVMQAYIADINILYSVSRESNYKQKNIKHVTMYY